ncbi:DNA-binding transcriptional regulator Fis [Halieaceae bacterium IMCC14734]|uniref:Putative Fis-like DNA-binding protein n=1 Tax=Candidatus Litorirhabdus singularis TaxID=2518993 RepID=A0ABT3TNJ9_9GAMM|nr:DNA-binding transcriptional regulator Fis [Candidatus Litorirhabdus singularis]MCX2983345.1 DNA-binding transcriptional regulator Fis [Candidatus Litorirhabdus singularis]
MLTRNTDAIARDTTAPVVDSPNRHSQLRNSVTRSVREYLSQLDGQLATDVYQMVLAEVEAPLLEEIMNYTRGNQTKASRMLGLNRGTLRKKLKQCGLLDESAE